MKIFLSLDIVETQNRRAADLICKLIPQPTFESGSDSRHETKSEVFAHFQVSVLRN